MENEIYIEPKQYALSIRHFTRFYQYEEEVRCEIGWGGNLRIRVGRYVARVHMKDMIETRPLP